MFNKIKYIFISLIWLVLFYYLFTSNSIMFLRIVAIVYAIGNLLDVVSSHVKKR